MKIITLPLVGLIVPGDRNESREKLVGAIALEIERSVPLEPVQLTSEGDLLGEYPPGLLGFGYEYFVNHTRDDHSLNTCVGVHLHCDSWMDRRRTTATHDAIICKVCRLRVLFPKEIKTYGELRKFLAKHCKPSPV